MLLLRTDGDLACVQTVHFSVCTVKVVGFLSISTERCATSYQDNDAHLKAPLAATLTVFALISVPLPWQLNSTWHTGEPACDHAEAISELY